MKLYQFRQRSYYCSLFTVYQLTDYRVNKSTILKHIRQIEIISKPNECVAIDNGLLCKMHATYISFPNKNMKTDTIATNNETNTVHLINTISS